MNSSGRHGSPTSLEASHDRSSNPRSFCKLYLCPIKQPSSGSAPRRGHFRFPFAFGALSRAPDPPPFLAMTSTPAFSKAPSFLTQGLSWIAQAYLVGFLRFGSGAPSLLEAHASAAIFGDELNAGGAGRILDEATM